jgi:hypothetical protein
MREYTETELRDVERTVIAACKERFGDFGVGANSLDDDDRKVIVSGYFPDKEGMFALHLVEGMGGFEALLRARADAEVFVAHVKRWAMQNEMKNEMLVDDIANVIYQTHWHLGIAVTGAYDEAVLAGWRDFGFDLPPLIIDDEGGVQWLDDEESGCCTVREKVNSGNMRGDTPLSSTDRVR